MASANVSRQALVQIAKAPSSTVVFLESEECGKQAEHFEKLLQGGISIVTCLLCVRWYLRYKLGPAFST